MSHTPGPWTYDSSEDAIMDAEENRLARVNYAHFEDSYFENCHLIAAAPDLLEALQHTLEDMHAEWSTHGGTRQMICEAIAKATRGER